MMLNPKLRAIAALKHTKHCIEHLEKINAKSNTALFFTSIKLMNITNLIFIQSECTLVWSSKMVLIIVNYVFFFQTSGTFYSTFILVKSNNALLSISPVDTSPTYR
jgi:hypothetical protein